VISYDAATGITSIFRPLPWVLDDGGRSAAGFRGPAGDCVCRAIAIAAQLPYLIVYNMINDHSKVERRGRRKRGKSNARTGVYKATIARVLTALGFIWTPCMGIGTGCRVHLRVGEVPSVGRLVVSLSRHSVAVINGIVHDTSDPSRDGLRCVYGYWAATSIRGSRAGRR
jgi:hypothetical protein